MYPVAVQYLQTHRVVAALMHVVACPCVPKTSTLGGRWWDSEQAMLLFSAPVSFTSLV
jgi:hypothetical protein